MLDKILGWLVIVAPFVLSAIFVLIPAKSEDRKTHMRWRIALLIFGLLFSSIAWWQQVRAADESASARTQAIQDTAKETAKQTTENLGAAYRPLIQSMTEQIGVLQKQLAEETKKVDVIGGSSIVTGKKPIDVVVKNLPESSTSADAPLHVQVSTMMVEPNKQYGKAAKEFILTTNKVMNGGRVKLKCTGAFNNGSSMIAGASAIMGGGGKTDAHTFYSGIDSPNWGPGFPLVITLYFDEGQVEPCEITLQ
jgi:hypothetical protein